MSTQTKTQQIRQSSMSLRVVIDKKGKRILYGEANKTFVDFLLTIFSLPLVTVVRLLSVSAMDWPLGNLYRSLQNMSVDYFENQNNKDNLVNPKIPTTSTLSQLGNVLPIESFSLPKTFYTCDNTTDDCRCRCSFSATFGALCPKCTKSMTTSATYVYGADDGEEGYVSERLTYMVMDDLTIQPCWPSASSISTIMLLKELNVVDVQQIEDKLLYFDINEGVKLLKASLHSTTVLTDVFLPKIDLSTTNDKRMKRKAVDKERII